MSEVSGPDVRVHPSATKHGLDEETARALWVGGVEDTWIDDRDPRRLLRLGLDHAGRPWELIGLIFDGGTRHLVIHAMPLRKATMQLLERRR